MKKMTLSLTCTLLFIHCTVMCMDKEAIRKDIDLLLINSAKAKAQQDPALDWLPAKIAAIIKNPDLNTTDDIGNTRLHYAVFLEAFPAPTLLIRIGADPAKLNDHGQDPLTILEELIKKASDQKKKQELEAHYKAILDAIAQYKGPAQRFKDNVTLLHRAIRVEDVPLIRELLSRDLSLANAQTTSLNTPLHFAIHYLESPQINTIIELLLKAGADPDTLNSNKETPLELLITQYIQSKFDPKIAPILYMLIESSKNINIANARGNTPFYTLTTALKDTKPRDVGAQILEHMLRKGANINVQNKDGFTPLHVAVTQQNQGLVNFLLYYGANPYIRSYKPRTMADIKRGKPLESDKTPLDIVDELKKAMPELERRPLLEIESDLLEAMMHREFAQQVPPLPEPTPIKQELSPTQQRQPPIQPKKAPIGLEVALHDLTTSLQALSRKLH